MQSLNDKISLRQLQVLLVLDILGTGVTALPRTAANAAAQDGWLSVLIATAAACLVVFMAASLAKRFPSMSFPNYTAAILPAPLATLLSLALTIKITLNCALELRIFGEIVRHTMLPTTPFAVVCATMLLISAYAAAKGYETRARIGEILIFIVLVPLVVIFGLSLRETDMTNLAPVLDTPPLQILDGAAQSVFAFTGMELVLLAFPYLSKPQKARGAATLAILATGLIMTIVTALTIARFTADGTTPRPWPVLDMMDTIELPGSFVERQEALMMSFWIVSLFAVVNAGLFFSSLLLRDIVRRGKHYMYVLLLLPVIFIISLLPESMTQTYNLLRLLNRTVGTAFYAAIIPLLLLAAILRKKGVRRGKLTEGGAPDA